jgi:hypothetical protein
MDQYLTLDEMLYELEVGKEYRFYDLNKQYLYVDKFCGYLYSKDYAAVYLHFNGGTRHLYCFTNGYFNPTVILQHV